MKAISEVTFCVCDAGLFLPMAVRLAEQAKRVIYWSPDCRQMPSIKQALIGDGFDNIERVRSYKPYLNEIDCFCFPDVNLGEEQIDLEARGKLVWGSRNAEWLELDRERFMQELERLGLDVPEYHVCQGWSELVDFLKGRKDVYVKISRYRADFETKHWRSWEEDQDWAYLLAIKFGPVKEEIRFLVFDAIESKMEIGADTYCVDGEWPELMLHGMEGKDKCYFSSVTERSEMPGQLTDIMEAFSPLLKQERYRNQWSMEVRVNDEGNFFIDATTRGGMPSSGSQQLLWENFAEIIWAGANGTMVQPVPAAKFSIECMITGSRPDPSLYESVALDPDLLPWVRFSGCCFINGQFAFPPTDQEDKDLGWLVALGDSPKETLERVKELVDMLPDGLSADVEALAEVIKGIEMEEKEGIEFSDQPLPTPEEVV